MRADGGYAALEDLIKVQLRSATNHVATSSTRAESRGSEHDRRGRAAARREPADAPTMGRVGKVPRPAAPNQLVPAVLAGRRDEAEEAHRRGGKGRVAGSTNIRIERGTIGRL